MHGIKRALEYLDSKCWYPPSTFRVITKGVNEPECVVDGKKYLMFCSNDYLSLSQHPAVKKAGKAAIDRFGLGPGGSRAMSGNISIITELEEEIARLTGTEDCLTFPTGYMANVTVFQALMDSFIRDVPCRPGESVIFLDESNHGSIFDGCRLCRAETVRFGHDDLTQLRAKLQDEQRPNKLIVTEGVFTPEGNITDLTEYVKVAKEFDARLMIDDAHGVGILGENGGGTPQHFGCAGEVDVLMGSMDKAFGGIGGYLCGSRETVKYLRVAARSSILSSSFPAGIAGAMIQSARLIERYQAEREVLFEKAKYLRSSLREAGFTILGNADLPAIPLLIGDEVSALKFNDLLWDQGIFCSVFRWPAVHLHKARLRIVVMLRHTKPQMDRLVDCCFRAGKVTGIV